MKYFSPEEIRASDNVKARLGNWVSPSIRQGFSIQTFIQYAKRLQGGAAEKILDAGLANGAFVQELYNAGFHNIYGVDIDDYVAAENRKLLIDFQKADLSYQRIPYGDGFFGAITAWCVVPHLENPHHFIREAYRVLKPGGLLIMTLINVTSPSHRKYFYKHGDFPGFHERNNHISLFTHAIFKKTVLRQFGLIGKEYLLSPSILKGWKGRMRKWIYDVSAIFPRLRSIINERWGPKVAYVLQKPYK